MFSTKKRGRNKEKVWEKIRVFGQNIYPWMASKSKSIKLETAFQRNNIKCTLIIDPSFLHIDGNRGIKSAYISIFVVQTGDPY